MRNYILEGHTPVPCEDAEVWAKWFEKFEDRIVAQTVIGESKVSTVFLGMDHNYFPGGPPLLFETMVFGGPLDQEQFRTSTWEQAELAHSAMCARIEPLIAAIIEKREEP